MELVTSYGSWSEEFVRIDKWLWAARFFKTRALASRAFELGRIHSNGQPAKPSREVRIGDLLQVKNDSGDFQIEVLLLSQMRGPATVARRFIGKPKPAARRARSWRKNAKPCRISRRCPAASHPSAIAANSTACADSLVSKIPSGKLLSVLREHQANTEPARPEVSFRRISPAPNACLTPRRS